SITYAVRLDWGDGTALNTTVAGFGGTFFPGGSHVYATKGIHPITMQGIDSTGAAAQSSTSFDGGLELGANGELRYYLGSDYMVLDTNVQQFVVQQGGFANDDLSNWTVYLLHADHTLWAVTPSPLWGAVPGNAPTQVASGIQSIALGADGNVYVR